MSASPPRLVAHLDTGREWRGGQAQVLMLMKGLARRGVQSLLLAPEAPLLEQARAAGIAAVRWTARGDLDLVAMWSAFQVLRDRRPDVVHTHTARAHAVGVPAARLARVPTVVVSRRVALVPRGGWGRLKYRMPVDRYLCVSRGVRDTLGTAGVPESRIVIVPSGVEAAAPRASGLRRELGLAPDALLVGTAAALTAEKRHEDLLQAAGQVRAVCPDAHFVWAGDGVRRWALERERETAGLGARVHLLGFRSDAAALMAQCDVVALASDHEGIATSLIEAQAAGVPVVATAVGGVPEVVRDGVTGRLVPARDPDALAAALVDLLTHPEARVAMGRAAAAAAGEFHIDRTVERTLAAYADASKGRSGPA